MGKLINFENYTPKEDANYYENSYSEDQLKRLADSTFTNYDFHQKEIADWLQKNFPNKLLFNQLETAKILGVSYQFVNRRCKNGIIKTTSMGRRQLIKINELIKIYLYGA